MNFSPVGAALSSPVLELRASQFNPIALAEQLFSSSTESIAHAMRNLEGTEERPIIALADLLKAITANQRHSPESKVGLVERLIGLVPFAEAMGHLLDKEPQEFLNVFDVIENEDFRKKLFEDLYSSLQDNLHYALVIVLKGLARGREPPDTKVARLNLLLSALSEESQKDLAQILMDNTSAEEAADITFYLNDESLCTAFAECFLNKIQEEDDVAETLRAFVEEYVQTVRCPEDLLFLETLLNMDEYRWVKRRILRNLHNYSAFGQACLFWCGSAKFRTDAAIEFQNEPGRIKACLEHIFELDPHVNTRICMVRDLISGFDEENFQLFIENLLEEEDKSPIIPYLYPGLSNEAFFILMVLEPQVRMELLNHSMPGSLNETRGLIEKITSLPDRLDIVMEQFPLLLGDTVHMVTLKQFLENPVLQNETAVVAFVGSLQKVPPFLLALAMPYDKYRRTILSHCKSLSEEQLQAVAYMLESTSLIETLEALAPPFMTYASYEVILANLSPQNKKLFVSLKAEKLQKDFANFKSRFDALQRHCLHAKSMQDIRPLIIEANYLAGFTRSVLSPDYSFLEKLSLELVERCNEDIFFAISRIRGGCALYQILLSAPANGTIAKLNALLPDDEFEDETAGISEEFWQMLTLKNLKEIKAIENCNEIFALGIKSDSDFDCLGMSLSQKHFLEMIRRTMYEKLSKNDSNTRVAILQTWEKILDLSIDPDSGAFQALAGELMALYDLNSHELTGLASVCLGLLKCLLMQNDLTEEERQNLWGLFGRLERPVNQQDIANCCKESIAFAIAYRKINDPLIKLKKYLSQPGLKKAWDSLHEQGVTRLSEIVKRGVAPQGLFRLEELFVSS